MSKPALMQVSDRILLRIYLLFACFALFGIAVVWRIVSLQTTQAERWRTVQQQERVYYKRVQADRGTIYSDDGSILAITLPFYRIAVDVTAIDRREYPSFEDTLDVLCKRLAARFGSAEYNSRYFKNKFKKAIAKRDRHVYLFPYARTLNYQEMVALRQLPVFNRGRFKGGLIVEKLSNKRFYPFHDLARVTLGLVRDDTVPFRGLEFSYQHLLRGTDGVKLVQRIPGGVEVPISEFDEVEARDGYELHTTLDVHMQDIVENALREGVRKAGAKGGTALLMEVQTGEIKAIANYPESFNMAVVASLEPGSTFKLPALMAALEDGYVRLDDRVNTGNGTVQYFDRIVRDAHGSGTITVQQVFEQSSNVGISKLIYEHYRNKPAAFIQRLEEMGALTPVGFQLKGEPAPYVIRPGDKLWSGPTLPLLSTGYNVQLTPVQVLAFYNAVANNGKLIQPLLVREVRRGSEVVARFQSAVLRERICSDATLAKVRKLLEGVVQNGTAKNIRGTYYQIAGKTGTAKKLKNGKYEKKYRASFAGYFPADQPRYSCFVLIDDPSNGEIYGAQLAAPIFKRIADNIHAMDLEQAPAAERFAARLTSSRLQFPVTRTLHADDAKAVYNTLNISTPAMPEGGFVQARQQGATVRLRDVKIGREHVPDVRQMSARDALALLENLGLEVRLQGHGKVRTQSVAPGSRLQPGMRIQLNLSSAAP